MNVGGTESGEGDFFAARNPQEAAAYARITGVSPSHAMAAAAPPNFVYSAQTRTQPLISSSTNGISQSPRIARHLN